MPLESSPVRRIATITLAALGFVSVPPTARAVDADSLLGVHWWGNSYPNPPSDNSAGVMLNSKQQGGWDLEIANTHNEFFWSAEWLRPLYQELKTNQGVSPITRINYAWGETVPGWENPDQATWKNNVVGVINTLKDYAHVWQLGNECNLHGESNHWGAQQMITPAGYAGVYLDVHAAMVANAHVNPSVGPHQLLIAPPSPGAPAGDRWMDGNDWLGQTIDAFGANKDKIDGIAIHAYGGGDAKQSVTGFRNSVAMQLALIDSKGLSNVPVYITEFNRYTDPNNPNDEATTAEFLRGAFKFLDQWNRTPGNHNVIAATWFVYDADQTAGGGWNGYSVEYWKTHGYPPGDSRDLYTAFQQTAAQKYKAGITGIRAIPAGVTLFDDFESGNGRFGSDPTTSQNSGIASGFKVATADDSYTHATGQKIGVTSSTPNNWYFRYLSGGGNPASNVPINLTSAASDGYVGFWLKVFTNGGNATNLQTQIVLDTGAGGGTNSDAGVLRNVITDGEWHYYEWNLDSPADWTSWFITGSDGVIPTNGTVTIDSIMFLGRGGTTVEYFLDSVMRNTNGSLSAMSYVPEPSCAMALIAVSASSRRRRARLP